MNYSTVTFKYKLGLVSFMVLASLVGSQPGVAMDNKEEHYQTAAPQIRKSVRSVAEVNDLLAQENDDSAQSIIMEFISKGRYTDYLTPDKTRFKEWNNIQERVASDDNFAHYVIIHYKELGEHFPNLFSRVQERAENSDAARYNLCLMYKEGHGVEKNIDEYRRLRNIAAHNKYAPACYSFFCSKVETPPGGFYDREMKKSEDQRRFRFCQTAAQKGYAPAQDKLADYAWHGYEIVEKNQNSALKWYKTAAERGYTPSANTLGRIFEQGLLGVEKDMDQAISWYKVAAEGNHGPSAQRLGDIYHAAGNIEKSTKWDERAAHFLKRKPKARNTPDNREESTHMDPCAQLIDMIAGAKSAEDINFYMAQLIEMKRKNKS